MCVHALKHRRMPVGFLWSLFLDNLWYDVKLRVCAVMCIWWVSRIKDLLGFGRTGVLGGK